MIVFFPGTRGLPVIAIDGILMALLQVFTTDRERLNEPKLEIFFYHGNILYFYTNENLFDILVIAPEQLHISITNFSRTINEGKFIYSCSLVY